jgi:enoyl-CoA hydratase
MTERVRYELDDAGVALVTMDDGKVNALSPAMLGDLGAAFDKAEADGAAVLLTGRPGVFSGGFDLRIIRDGSPAERLGMVRGGFELAERVLSFPRPVVVAASGHAIAMGFFLTLAADLRIAPAGEFRFSANEVAIGLSVPHTGLALMRYRMTPAAADRGAITAAAFGPDEALAVGILTEVVGEGDVLTGARTTAAAVAALHAEGFRDTKLRAHTGVLAELRAGLAEMG